MRKFFAYDRIPFVKIFRRYVGDKNFYKTVFAVALPIMLQNGITQFVNLLDNIMVGQVGNEQMSGVAIVNQLLFVFNLCVFGAVSGAGIFTAQFHGKNNEEGVRQTFRFKFIFCFFFALFGIGVLALFNESLIGLYLSDGSAEGDLALTLSYGQDYLWIMLIGLMPFALTQSYGSTLRETEKTVLPMVAGFIAVGLNCIGNYILIFGRFGAPALGVKGAAISTVVSRFLEVGILVVTVWVKRKRYPFIVKAYRYLFRIDKKLVSDIFRKGMLLLVNEALWAGGVSALAQCYSQRGLAVVAGYNISSTVTNVFNISYMALGISIGIIIGKYLGAKDFDRAVDEVRKMVVFSVFVGVLMGVVMAAFSSFFPQIYNTTEEAKELASDFMLVTACMMPVYSFQNACYFTLRSGGKTLITFFYDSVFVWVAGFPVAFLLVKLTTLPVIDVFLVVCAMDVLKSIFGYVLLKKRIWLNQLV